MRWIASCVASLAVATCLCGATAIARPILAIGPARTITTNGALATQARKAHRPSTHAPRPSGTTAAKTVLLGYDAVRTGRRLESGGPARILPLHGSEIRIGFIHPRLHRFPEPGQEPGRGPVLEREGASWFAHDRWCSESSKGRRLESAPGNLRLGPAWPRLLACRTRTWGQALLSGRQERSLLGRDGASNADALAPLLVDGAPGPFPLSHLGIRGPQVDHGGKRGPPAGRWWRDPHGRERHEFRAGRWWRDPDGRERHEFRPSSTRAELRSQCDYFQLRYADRCRKPWAGCLLGVG